MKINIGSGNRPMFGFWNTDIEELDLTVFPYPIGTDVVGHINCRCVLEHIERKYTMKIFEQFYRICRHNALIDIEVPFSESWIDWIDHKQGFSVNTFYSLTTKKYRDKWHGQFNYDLISLELTPCGIGHLMPHWIRKPLSNFIKGIVYTIKVRIRVVK